MSNKSDHIKPRTTIETLLPEVYRSDVNNSVFGNAFNKHLTPDETVRVAGYIGQGHPGALVNRQIAEPTPHRQAYQLEPVMFTKVGTQNSTLSHKGFLTQLELMGVDINRLPSWGDTTQFNWVPPVNIDMLINYADYYWKPSIPGEAPQYLTIEGRCLKATSKVSAYDTVVGQYGGIIHIDGIDVANNAFTLVGRFVDLFETDFIFYTKNTTDLNLKNKFWHVAESDYNATTGVTSITPVEEIAIRSATPPAGITQVGRWWYNTSTGQLKAWNGTAWVFTTSTVSVDISLMELRDMYQSDADCACNGSYGWDVGQFDDNQTGSTLWNVDLLAQISFASEADWMAGGSPANGSPAAGDVWYDISTDALKQYTGSAWVIVDDNFSYTLQDTRGIFAWDQSSACNIQEPNDWTRQNMWIHKSSVTSSDGIIRAQMPILEYGSTVELNEWTEVVHSWKYRTSVDSPFTSTTRTPTRFELEPIRNYTVTVGTEFTIELDDLYTRDLDMSQVFVPGFRFRVVDAFGSETYTVKSAITRGTPADGVYTTITIDGNSFTSALTGGVNESRIEPLVTSTGDVWRGYHLHWLLDQSATVYRPAPHAQENYLLRDAIQNPPSHVNYATPTELLTSPVRTAIGGGVACDVTSSNFHQEALIQDGTGGAVTINLLPALKYTAPGDNHTFALKDTELRVYVNDVRQYGTYTETIATVTPGTFIGTDEYFSSSFDYVTSITFDNALHQYDVVRIEVAPAAVADMGWSCIPIRTTLDDYTPPEYVSLARFVKQEQTKTQVNQYPLFNMFNVRGELVTASSLFSYTEDITRDINANIQRRVIVSDDGRDYLFDQQLVSEDNGELYAFHNTYLLNQFTGDIFWYDSFHGELKFWDVTTWATTYVNTTTGVNFTPVISGTAPTLSYGVNDAGALWFDTTTQNLYQYDGAQWVEKLVHIFGTDPLLQTVWRHGLHDEQYIPSYVDENREPITIGNPMGDWETLDQWFYNSEHHNYKSIKYTELISHLASMAQQQPAIPGLAGSSAYTLTQNNFNYGIGGTIKEHNYSFDTLISAVNVTNVTPVGVIEFAEDQYDTLMLMIRDIFNRSSIDNFSNYSSAYLIDQPAAIVSNVIESFQLNDFATSVYGDTTAYNNATGRGIHNWIITPAIMGLAPVIAPHVVTESGLVEVFHHDGHRTRVSYAPVEEDKFARTLCGVADTRISNGTLGIVSSSIPPQTDPLFIDAFGGMNPRVGVYWYQTGNNRQLYRFAAYAVATLPPSVIVNGVELADGIRYYNSATLTVYEKQGLTWIPITVDGAGDISVLWERVSLQDMLAGVYLHIEQELYQVAAPQTSKFDYNTLTVGVGDQVVYDQYIRSRFDAYIASHRIPAPFANSTYSPSNAFSWNYTGCLVVDVPRSGVIPEPQASWQALYNSWFGTPYPHLEPWVLQGYNGKPSWWDSEYRDTTGVRVWNYNHATTTGMWQNVMVGVIPVGKTLPSGAISTGAPGQVTTYAYLPVNISDSTLLGGYAVDSLLPPYYDNSSISVTLPTVRSLFTDLQSQIIGPDSDYVYGDGGPIEWAWRVSTERVFDQLIVAFQMQPVRFFQAAFGLDLIEIDGLQVDGTTKQVYTHERVLFHGDVYDGTKVYHATGLNQWYVNFNRYSGYDTNTDFRELWAAWSPKLSYLSAGVMDTSTLEVFSKYMDVGDQDYQVVLANTGVISDAWADSFQVDVLHVPPAIIQYNNQNLWKFSVDTAASIDRTMSLYGVQHYPVMVNPALDTFNAFTFMLSSADAGSRRLYIVGDYQNVFTEGLEFDVMGTTNNNGSYTVVTSVYETNSDRTRITVVEPLATQATGGYIELTNFILPWETGDMVFGFSTKMMPAPVFANAPYYIIKTGNRTFKLATTQQEALSGIYVDVTSAGTGNITIGKVASSFKVFGGAGRNTDTWYHFEIDRSTTFSMAPPTTVYGIQKMINIIDGYSTMAADMGITFSVGGSGEVDPDTGRTVSWQLEIERFIDFLFGLQNTRLDIEDRYDFVVDDISTNELRFTGTAPKWSVGQEILLSTTGTLPTPLFGGTAYYFNPTSGGKFTVSYSKVPTGSSIVDISGTGSGQLTVGRYRVQPAFPRFEMNPIRNNVWINTPLGWLSDIVVGPYTDIRTNQTIYDQYGRPITPDKLLVFRQDKQSRISIRNGIANDVEPAYTTLDDPYNYLHIGGCHLFTEGYEHIVMFNDYTVGGGLVYDSFVGLNTKKFDVDFQKSSAFTLRPSLGGFYLLDNEFNRNLEGAVSDIRNMYDTFTVPEMRRETKYARALLGYKGDKEYYDLVNLNSKSQFLFYRGMIQAKGSTNSIKAYINSRRFVDAKIDEYWAWKLAEFGDYRPKVYPALKLQAVDGELADVRFEFVSNTDDVSSVDTTHNFEAVTLTDEHNGRWDVMPETRLDINYSSLFLNSSIVRTVRILYSGNVLTLPPADYDYMIDDAGIITDASGAITTDIVKIGSGSGTKIIVNHSTHCDGVVVTLREYHSTVDLSKYTTSVLTSGHRPINADIYELDNPGTRLVTLYCIGSSPHTNSPSALIDKKSNVVLSSAQYWDPARNHHSSAAIHNVDLQLPTVPSKYTNDLVVATSNSDAAWNSAEVGTRWMDTSMIKYTPYYDTIVNPNVNDRLAAWGNLAGWSSMNVYEWVSSSIPPEQWDKQAALEEVDPTISAEHRATGNVRQQTYKRTRQPVEITGIVGDVISVVAPPTFGVGDTVLFIGDTLPVTTVGSIEAGVPYYVVSITGNDFTVSVDFGGPSIDFITAGVNVSVVPSFTANDWVLAPTKVQTIHPSMVQPQLVGTISTISLDTTIFAPDEVVDVYVNGKLMNAACVVESTTSITVTLDIVESDTIDVVMPEYLPTAEELDFSPDVEDDGTVNTQWSRYTPYTTNDIAVDGVMTTMYYFWIENGITRNPARTTPLSLAETTQQLVTIPTPHFVVQKLVIPPIVPLDVTTATGQGILPMFYRQVVLRNANAYISDNDRFIWRFTNDRTLRNDLSYGTTQLDLKNKHTEWLMLREQQPSAIPRTLWDRMTESMVGYKLDSPSTRVPSLDRELYDDVYGTDTQYGLGDEQTFVNGQTALTTVLAYLEDANVNFSPMNIDDFFARNDFTTVAGIELAMDEIYRSFGALHVNHMWFSVLYDAMTTKNKYRELFKTSWIALHGIRVLEVGGLFDD